MIKASLQAAIQETRDELVSIDERIQQIGAALEEARSTKRGLQRDLKALLRIGNSDSAATPAATKEAVRPLVEALLADNPTMQRDDLYDLVRDKLAQAGVSANGLGLRMKEVLGEPWVAETAPGVFAKRPGGAVLSGGATAPARGDSGAPKATT